MHKENTNIYSCGVKIEENEVIFATKGKKQIQRCTYISWWFHSLSTFCMLLANPLFIPCTFPTFFSHSLVDNTQNTFRIFWVDERTRRRPDERFIFIFSHFTVAITSTARSAHITCNSIFSLNSNFTSFNYCHLPETSNAIECKCSVFLYRGICKCSGCDSWRKSM